MGKFVILKHPGGITTIYGHLSDIYVGEKEFVRQGTAVGAVGKTGNANSREILTHLHFEVRKNNSPQDPLIYLE
jgi:murein DD-endopeptidase MepM/ murein hydrolase activator NlpD